MHASEEEPAVTPPAIVEPYQWCRWSEEVNGLQFRFRTLAVGPEARPGYRKEIESLIAAGRISAEIGDERLRHAATSMPVTIQIRNVGQQEVLIANAGKMSVGQAAVCFSPSVVFQGKRFYLEQPPLALVSKPDWYVPIAPGKTLSANIVLGIFVPKGRFALYLDVPRLWSEKAKETLEAHIWSKEDFERIDAKAWRWPGGRPRHFGAVWITQAIDTGLEL